MGDSLTADQLLQLLTQALYFFVFLRVGYKVIRRPRRISLDIALFFGALAAIVTLQWLQAALRLEPNAARSVLAGAFFMALPYLLLRLVDDFTDVPRWIMRSAEIGLALMIVVLIVLNALPARSPQRTLPTLALVVYFVVLEVYAAQQFVREAQRTSGVTRRRMQAAAAGSMLLGVVIGLYDRVRITQLITNLLENAVKYSPDGGSVEVRIWQELKVAHVTVTDRGIGIPASDVPFVFERFWRGTNVDDRRFSGMGLGLFICRAIVAEHGGTIEAVSRLGEGTTMHVRLPTSVDVPANAPVMVPAI